MKDQVDTLVGNGVPAALYNSSLVADEKAAVVAGLRAGTLSPAVRLARAAGRRRRRRLSGAARRRAASASSRSTKRTASASGATTSGPSTASSAGCAQLLPGVSLHAYTATATARVRRDIAAQLGLRDPVELVGSFDRPNLVYRVLPRGDAEAAAARRARAASRRGGHHLLHVATRGRRAGRLADRHRRARAAVPRRPLGRGAQPQPGRVPQRARPTSSSPPSRSAWASTAPTCASSSTPARRGRSSTTSRSRDAPGRDGLEAECLLIYSTGDFMKWRVMLERNGELTDAARRLLRQMERYATGVGCRHRHLAEYFGDRYGRKRTAAPPATTAWTSSSRRPIRSCSRARSCRAWRASASGSAPTHVASVLRGHASEQVLATGPRQAEHVRPAAGRLGRRGSRLHRAARRPRPAAADRRRVSGARADAQGLRSAEGRDERARA